MASWSLQSTLAVILSVATAVITSPSHAQAPPASPSAAPSVERMIEALTPRRTRGIAPSDNTAAKKIEQLATVRRTRGLSHREQDELHAATANLPQMDLEVFFDFNSATIAPSALTLLDNLGKALNADSLKAGTIIVAGHTDAKGSDAYNQSLSDRRAAAVAQYLVQQHKIDAARLVSTGYGFRKLKVATQPLDPQNRRVQIINAAK